MLFSCSLADFLYGPIVTSVCLQVPRDTERPPGRLEFHLVRVISAVMYLLGHVMYLRHCSTHNTTLFSHHQCESLDCLRSRQSLHRTARGPGKLVLGMASAMGNNRGVFIPPSFPSLGPHRNLY